MKCQYYACNEAELVDYKDEECLESGIMQCPKCKTLHQVTVVWGSTPDSEIIGYGPGDFVFRT